ncbi:hypothetical protein PENTCL1PPCAC_18882, partial [Pristionchus entomophagus]
ITFAITTGYNTPSSHPFVAYLAGKIQRTENWTTYSPFLSVYFSLTFFIPYSQDCLNLIIALNGFTAIAIPAKHRKNSNGPEFRLCLFGILLWLCSLPVLVYQILLLLLYFNIFVLLYGYPLVIITKSLTPPLLLIFSNPNLRRE